MVSLSSFSLSKSYIHKAQELLTWMTDRSVECNSKTWVRDSDSNSDMYRYMVVDIYLNSDKRENIDRHINISD